MFFGIWKLLVVAESIAVLRTAIGYSFLNRLNHRFAVGSKWLRPLRGPEHQNQKHRE